MSIQPSDILVRYSVTAGSQGNTQPQPSPDASLGGYISTTSWFGSAIGDLFEVFTGSDNANMVVRFRCVLFYNATGTGLTWQNATAWFSSLPGTGAQVSIGADPAGVTPVGSTSLQAAIIANENTAPAGVTFSQPITPGAGVNLGNIPPGYCAALWIKVAAVDSVAVVPETATLSISGDSN